MAIDYNELVTKWGDLLSVVNEVFLNKFSASHHKTAPHLYVGKQRFSNFDNDVELRYQVRTPIQFDLSPVIRTARFKRLWITHLKAKGAKPDLVLTHEVLTTPPNLRLYSDDVLFDVVVYEGHSNTEKMRVDFDWAMEALAAISLVENAVRWNL